MQIFSMARPIESGGVELFRRGNELHVIPLKHLNHIRKVQNGTADTIELVYDHLCDPTLFHIPDKLLKHRPICIFPAVAFVCVLFTITGFQFVFAKLDLAFNRNAVLLVYRLSCINRVYSIVHASLLFLSQETKLLTEVLYQLNGFIRPLPAAFSHICGTSRKAAAPVPDGG